MHKFAIYLKKLSSFISDLNVGDETVFRVSDLRKRIINVLRLKENEAFILFDEEKNIEFLLLKKTFQNKKTLNVKIVSINKNELLKPEVILCPGLLKKKYFEDAVYLASQMAATKICPILTSQVHKNWLDQKNIDRLEKILISACEQSKNFIIPSLEKPIELKTFLEKESFDNSKKVYFHINGKSLLDLLSELNQKKYEKIYLFFGPEGDFTKEELDLLRKYKIENYKLTSTVLRSIDAISVGLGSVKSVV